MAKIIAFDEEARRSLERGMNTLDEIMASSQGFSQATQQRRSYLQLLQSGPGYRCRRQREGYLPGSSRPVEEAKTQLHGLGCDIIDERIGDKIWHDNILATPEPPCQRKFRSPPFVLA